MEKMSFTIDHNCWFKQFNKSHVLITKQDIPNSPATAVQKITINSAAIILQENRQITEDKTSAHVKQFPWYFVHDRI